MTESKYGKHIYRRPAIDQGKTQTGTAESERPGRSMGGRGNLPFVYTHTNTWPELTVNCNFAMIHVTSPYLLADAPHSHTFDELLYFIGGNPADVNEFGAVIEVALGEEWEKHVIDTTSIIYIPAGLSHCPINVKKVDKPVLFGHILLSGAYTKQ